MILLASLLLTVAAWQATRRQTTRSNWTRFEFAVETIETAIRERLRAYEHMLYGAAGLFAASEVVTRQEWRTYADALHIGQDYPGVQGLGFAKRVLPAEKGEFLRQIRAEGFPDFSIRPDGERPEYTAIIYLEPFDWRNQRAFGYDMFSEPVRREAMARARDSGLPALSGKVTLVQETDQDVQAGFLLYVPVYHKGAPPLTPEQRRETLDGYVYSPFRMDDLMRGILREQQGYVDLQIFDGDGPHEPALLYRGGSAEGRFAQPDRLRFATRQGTLEFGGHCWFLAFASSRYFEEGIDTGKATTVLGAGIMISLLLFGMFLVLVNRQTALETLVAGRTAELHEREQRLATILHSLGDAVIATDTVGRVALLNPMAEALTGWSRAEARGKPLDEVFHIINEETRVPVNGLMERVLYQGETVAGNHSLLIARNGSELPITASAAPIRAGNGAGVSGLVLVFRDQTAERAARRMAWLLERSKVAAVLENSAAGLILCNEQGGEISMNEAALRFHGFASAEDAPRLVGEYAEEWELRYPDGRIMPYGEWPAVRAIRGDFVRDFEVHYRNRRSGCQRVCRLTSVPVRNSAGEVRRIVQTLFDITEHKQAELALEKSQRLLAETAGVGKVGGWEFDIDTGKQTWTAETYRIHEVECTYEPTVEKGINFYTPASRPVIERVVQAVIKHGQPFDVELEIITAKGNLRSVHAIGKPDLKHRRIYGFFQDITERKRAEAALLASEARLAAAMEASSAS